MFFIAISINFGILLFANASQIPFDSLGLLEAAPLLPAPPFAPIAAFKLAGNLS